MFEDDLLDPNLSPLSTNPFAEARRRRLLELERSLPKDKGWAGVPPEVDARRPLELRMPPPEPRPAIGGPPDVHMPEEPGARMMPPPAGPVPPPPDAAPPAPPQQPKNFWVAEAEKLRGPGLGGRMADALAADSAENKRRRISDSISNWSPITRVAPSAETHQNVMALETQRAADEQDHQQALAREAADPRSSTSMQARARLKALMPDLAAKLGPEFETVPATALPGWKELLADQPKPKQPLSPEEIDLKKAEAERARAEAAKFGREPAAKPGDAGKEFDPAGTRETIGAAYVGELKKRPELAKRLAGAHTKEEFDAIEKTLEGDRSGQRSVVNVTLGNRLRDEDTEKGATIPGLEHNPDVRLTPEQAGKVRDAKGEADMLAGSITKLQALVKKKGIDINPRDPDYPVMQGLLKDIQLQAKGPAMYQLGVLSGPDMSILEQVTGDPTSWRSLFQGKEGLNSRLETMKQQVGSRLNAKLGAHGYAVPPSKREDQPATDETRIIKGHKYEKRGGEWYQVD